MHRRGEHVVLGPRGWRIRGAEERAAFEVERARSFRPRARCREPRLARVQRGKARNAADNFERDVDGLPRAKLEGRAQHLVAPHDLGDARARSAGSRAGPRGAAGTGTLYDRLPGSSGSSNQSRSCANESGSAASRTGAIGGATSASPALQRRDPRRKRVERRAPRRGAQRRPPRQRPRGCGHDLRREERVPAEIEEVVQWRRHAPARSTSAKIAASAPRSGRAAPHRPPAPRAPPARERPDRPCRSA